MSATLSELAARFGCQLHGTPERVVSRVATLGSAGPDAVSFLANPRYRERLASTRAAAVILSEAHRNDCPVAALVTDNPYAVYARIAAYLHPPPELPPGVHPTACVAEDASIADSAHVGAHAVIESGARIESGAAVGAGSVVGANARIGARSRLAAGVIVLNNVVIGERCIVHPGAVIGADGFGFAREGAGWIKIPQVGGVVIGNDVEIGANTTIDRGAIEDTVIEDGVKLDNLIQIAHNVRVGEHTVIAAMVGIAGSTSIGKRCMIGGQAGIIGHLDVCDDVTITVRALVTRSIKEPGTYSGYLPADEDHQWRKNAGRFKRLDALAKRVADLGRRFDTIEKRKKGRDQNHE